MDNLFTEQTPNWVSFLFSIVIFLPVVLIVRLVVKAIRKETVKFKKQIIGSIVIFYLIYFAVINLMSYQGFFKELSIPPTIIIYTTFPLLIFYLFAVYNLKIFKQIINFINVESLIKLHIFRLIGSFFIILYSFEAIPKTFGLVAGIGDITVALSSIIVANYYKRKKNMAKLLAFSWNTIGLLDIFVTSGMAIYYTKISIDTGVKGVIVLTEIPFCLIPAFAPATIIFLHFLIYIKLTKSKI